MKTIVPVLLLLLARIGSGIISDAEWENYKTTFHKEYDNLWTANWHRFCLAVNMGMMNIHNNKPLESYKLGANQYSDMKFVDFVALFPQTIGIPSNAAPFTPPSVTAPPKFSYLDQGYSSPVQDQGKGCNSGWAFAAATVIQIFHALIAAILNSPTLSAQNLIDCAGGSKACDSQVPQAAFDYMTQKNQMLYPLSSYPRNPYNVQGMCALPAVSTDAVSIKRYSTIPDGADDLLKIVVSLFGPVVIEFNPATPGFMNYKDGVLPLLTTLLKASHYMTVVGYDTDTATGKDYWLVQNSFGTTWGESGMMRIERNPAKPITKSAMFLVS